MTRTVTLAEGPANSNLPGTVDPLRYVVCCVIAIGLHYEHDENLEEKVNRLLTDLPGVADKCCGCIWLRARDTSAFL